MDKFELKEILIELHDNLADNVAKMMRSRTDNEETGAIRSRVLYEITKLSNAVAKEIYDIY